METRFDIARIFWPLLVGSFLLAVFGAVVSIWLSTRPFLQEIQMRTASSATELHASGVEAYLERNAVATAYLASDPIVVAFATGAVTTEVRVFDRLDLINKPDAFQSVQIFDFMGTPLLARGLTETGLSLATVEAAQSAANALLRGAETAGQTDRPPRRFDLTNGAVLISKPVVAFGAIEGVVVVEVELAELALSLHEPGGLGMWLSESPDTEDLLAELVEPVADTGLYLHHAIDTAEVDSVGYAMIRTGTLAVLLSLMLPFAVLAAIGQRGILKPTEDLAASRDVLRRQKKELAELAAIATRADDSILITDLDGRVRWVNPAFERMTGYSKEELIGQQPEALMEPEARDPIHRQMLAHAFRNRTSVHLETLNRHKTGPDFWIRLHVSPLQDEDGVDYGFVCISNDITKQREDAQKIARAQEAIRHQALHDELTGLANRRRFNLEIECRMAPEATAPLTMIRLDLDHFKMVNDTLGHGAGDKVLQDVAAILTDETRAGDLPVRIGGDEFIVLLSPDCPLSAASHLAERMRARIAQHGKREGFAQPITSSIGIASSEGGLVGPAEVLSAADIALYAAKERGRNTVVVYDASLDRMVQQNRTREAELRNALDTNAFVPFYQPKVDAQTHAIVGVEVLARWNHPTRGIQPPAEFFGAAERLGLMEQIDLQIQAAALRDMRDLESRGLTAGNVAFNITAERLASDELLHLVEESGLTDTQISLEILESVLLDDDLSHGHHQIEALREAGARIEIDDFGSGHASLIAVLRIGPDVLKIDGRLVRDSLGSRQHRDILASIVEIASALDLSVVAEGVETMDHAELMRDMGCETLQGYAFGRPMPLVDLVAQLETTQPTPRRAAG